MQYLVLERVPHASWLVTVRSKLKSMKRNKDLIQSMKRISIKVENMIMAKVTNTVELMVPYRGY